MRGVILQPGYIPWLGFFNQMQQANLFVYLDDIQYDRRGWRNRNRIKSPNGSVWLTVPVIQKGRYKQIFMETKIDNSSKWVIKQLNAIRLYYSKTKHFNHYFPALESILKRNWEYLIDLDLEIIDWMRESLKISTPTKRASDFAISNEDKTGRLVEICQNTGIKEYISGPLCENYLDLSQFQAAGIKVYLHHYHHPEYEQRFPPFEPYLSAIDLLFNEGESSHSIFNDSDSLIMYKGAT